MLDFIRSKLRKLDSHSDESEPVDLVVDTSHLKEFVKVIDSAAGYALDRDQRMGGSSEVSNGVVVIAKFADMLAEISDPTIDLGQYRRKIRQFVNAVSVTFNALDNYSRYGLDLRHEYTHDPDTHVSENLRQEYAANREFMKILLKAAGL